jgi:hypothetical protein
VDHYVTVNSYPSLAHTARTLWKLFWIEAVLIYYFVSVVSFGKIKLSPVIVHICDSNLGTEVKSTG